MSRLLGIDVGTSGVKALLIDEHGHILAQTAVPLALSVPQPLWSEQDPEDWWTAVQSCLSALPDGPIDAIGLTGQMHGAAFLDEARQVIRPAMLWNDQRTAAECAEIDRLVGPERVRAITGNPPLTGFQLPKILWLRRHEPESFARVRHVLLPKDFVRERLTGVLATDVADASGVGALDLGSRQWSREILDAVGVPSSHLPPIFESDEVTAWTPEGRPVVAGAGDQAAAAIGTGVVEPGIVTISLGTSGVVAAAIPEPRPDPTGAVHVFGHANRAYFAMGVMLSCGGAVAWLRDTLYPNEGYGVADAEAAATPAGCAGLTFLPYLTGERCPHLDPDARAAWVGMTLAHGRGHLARAVLEGATFGLRDCYDRLLALGAQTQAIRVNGGGARSSLWRQILADVLQHPIQTLEVDEGPAFGAALLAGVGAGIWPDVSAATRDTVRVSGETWPSGVDYAEALDRFRRLYPKLRA
ncbi:MAG TPA: xylulokinase [Fimbriimonadaceae bacterium]|nr:xylulokinase [Fimbriimonadaceae bacterium]